MTVSSTTTKNSYSGNGSTTTFAYGFKIFADADLTVILRSSTGVETVQSLTTHYTVTNAGNASGGNVVFGSAPASGVTVVIRRNMALTQSTDYVANDPFPAATHEDALDRLTFISQQMQEEVDRTIKLSRTNTMTSTEFTVGATDRASKVLAFDSSGELSVTQELGTFKGSDATVTTAAYVERDIIKSTTTAELNNVYICVAASVVGDSLTDTDHFALLVDAVSAASSATTATTKASEAATSATNAANSASTASTQASNASTSASTASTQATNAANSATAAQNAQTAAEAALDTFDDRFLGAKSSNPSVDNDGNALLDGALYFDTTNDIMKVYDLTNNQWRQLTLTTTNQNNVNTVAGIQANVTTVAGISSDVTTVAGISSNVSTVASAATNVNNVGGSITNVNTVASNLSGVNSFAERYRVQSGVPSSDNDVGDLVFDTAANTLKVFGSSGFQNAGSSVNGTSERFTYNITGTPTTLTGASGTGFTETGGKTLAYDAGFLDVYLNGVKMVNGTDVTVTSGDSVVFASALSSGDVVDIVTFGTFQVATLNASNLASGTIPDARFPATLPAISGANLTNLDATDLTGTVASARISGSYTSITGTGALDAGSITSGFGNIDNGTSTLTTGNSDINGTLNVQGETTLQTHLNMGDSDKIKLGDSGDLEIYHDGSNSFVDDTGTGNLFLRGESQVIIGNMTGEQAAVFNDDGAVTLNHDNSAKFATTSSGIDVTGGITADGEIDVASSSSLSTISATATGSANLVMGTNFSGSASQGMPNQCGFINMRQSFPIVFGTAETERLRITNDGQFCVGATSAGVHKGIVSGNTGGNAVFKAANTASSGNTTCYIAFMDGSGSASVNSAFFQGFNGANNFYLLGNGTQTFTSDVNAKKNIETTRDGYLEDLAKLRVVKYNWKEQEDGEDKELGLIAQEVEKVFPKLVMNDIDPQIADKDKKKMIKTTVLPFMLLKALQEANTKITALETENKTQATQIADLISRITALESA